MMRDLEDYFTKRELERAHLDAELWRVAAIAGGGLAALLLARQLARINGRRRHAPGAAPRRHQDAPPTPPPATRARPAGVAQISRVKADRIIT